MGFFVQRRKLDFTGGGGCVGMLHVRAKEPFVSGSLSVGLGSG
jgi:hypothetical protein